MKSRRRKAVSNKQKKPIRRRSTAYSSGFTLIETMVAVSILALAIAGPMYVAGRSIVYAQIARDELIAVSLAQEGIEFVRRMRDNSYLFAYRQGGSTVSATAWNNFTSGGSLYGTNPSIYGCAPPAKCTLDPLDTGLRQYSESANVPMLYLDSSGKYNQRFIGTATPFKRTIQATAISPTDELIVSTVSWTFRGTSYTVSARDHLTPWQ
ncbi:type II secretion system protein [Candidatus Kaiserbacteria bacterium]|nr:type II secretion system protein [Candidatus Kaiserbacteria bacterium]